MAAKTKSKHAGATKSEKSKKVTKNTSGGGGFLFYLFFILGTAVLAAAIVIQRMPAPIAPIAYDMPDPPSLSGPLSQNEALKASKSILKSIGGPESIAFYEDHLYTGTFDGKILKIDRSGGVSVIAEFGSGNNISTRGRPLGLRIDVENKHLYVADSYLGVFKVDLATGKYEKVFPFDDQMKVTFFDDLDILPNGDLVLSEASVKFHYDSVYLDFFESAGTGRVIKIDLKNKRYEVLRKGLFFPNGVQKDLRDNGQSVLVTESGRNRILRIFTSGDRKGDVEMFADNLPGLPDNLRASEKGDGYWVAFGGIRAKEHDSFPIHALRGWPSVRLLLVKLIPTSWYHHEELKKAHYSLAVKLDLNGRIVESLHDSSASVLPKLTEVEEHSGSLFFGNFDGFGIGYLDRNCKKDDSCFFKIRS